MINEDKEIKPDVTVVEANLPVNEDHEHKPVDGQPSLLAKLSISAEGFTPSVLNINTGTRVEWSNDDDRTHWICSDDIREFNSPELLPGDLYDFPFMVPGVYTYRSKLVEGFTGKIVVV
jgi:plastocyanin